MVFTSVPIAFAATEDEGLVIDKTAVFNNTTGEGLITLSSYLKGEVKSTPTDVVLVIDHSGSMWTAVDPDNGKLSYSQLDKKSGVREGYYAAFSKTVADEAHLIRYYNNKWQISRAFSSAGVTTSESGKFVGFINTTLGTERGWTNLSDADAEKYDYYVSISGALYTALDSFMYEMRNAVNCRIAVVTFAGTVKNETKKDKNGNTIYDKDNNPLYSIYLRDKNSHSKLNPDVDYEGSGIFIDGTLTWDSTAPHLDDSTYAKAFEDPTTVQGQKVLNDTIDAINTDYGNTPTALGLLYARRLFIEAGRSGSNKVAIVFTDGIPNPTNLQSRGVETTGTNGCDCTVQDYTKHFTAVHYRTGSTYNTATDEKIQVKNILTDEGERLRKELNDTLCPYCDLVRVSDNIKTLEAQYELRTTYIDQAYQLKNAQKATVYSIGPTAGKAGTTVLENIATSKEHYYNASSDQLNKVFEDIAGVLVQSSQQLNSNTQLVDTPSATFMLPEALTKELEGKTETQKQAILKKYINVYTADYDGVDADGNDKFKSKVTFADAKIELVGEDTIKVSNFAYDKNAVFMAGDTANGKKLIVEIPFTPKPGFLGGEDVITNTSPAGIYNGAVLIKEFKNPDVDVNLETIVPDLNSKDIYVSQQTSIPEVTNLGKYVLDGETYTIDGENNKYVDIKYTIETVVNGVPQGDAMEYYIPAGTRYSELTDLHWKNSEDINTHPCLTEDVEYRVICNVISKKTDTYYTEPDEPTVATVNVYKPVITFNDTVLQYGAEVNYDDNGGTVVWKHGDDIASEISMGAAPKLQYIYTAGPQNFEEDTPVKVEAISKSTATNRVPVDTNVTPYTTFYREACSYEDCDHKAQTLVSSTDSNRTNFVVHIKPFDIVINKTGANTTLDENQSFVFRVNGPKGFLMDVVINGNGTKTIKDVPAGVYTVTEITEWSWRYFPADQVIAKEANAARAVNDKVTVDFANDRTKKYWLSGDYYMKNLFNHTSQGA